MGLAQMYETKLRENGMGSAQVLLTHADLADRERYLNARSTLLTLLQLDVVPVINENDTVVNDEIKFGDNDTLGALVANLVEADALVILTDQKGLYSADPRKDPAATLRQRSARRRCRPRSHGRRRRLQPRQGRHDHQDPCGQARRGVGRLHRDRLGPRARLPAAAGPWRSHRHAAGGADPEEPGAQALDGSDHLQLRGAVTVDDGAAAKVRGEGKSLLPIGMTTVEGEFSRGDVIAVRDPAGAEIARGLANYASAEARLLCRKPSSEIERLLGYVAEPEMIHRTNLVVTR